MMILPVALIPEEDVNPMVLAMECIRVVFFAKDRFSVILSVRRIRACYELSDVLVRAAVYRYTKIARKLYVAVFAATVVDGVRDLSSRVWRDRGGCFWRTIFFLHC